MGFFMSVARCVHSVLLNILNAISTQFSIFMLKFLVNRPVTPQLSFDAFPGFQ